MWMPIESAPECVEVETKIDDGGGVRNEQSLVRKGPLWFFPDMGMYVYYTPTHWRPALDGLGYENGGPVPDGPNSNKDN